MREYMKWLSENTLVICEWLTNALINYPTLQIIEA